MPEAKARYPAEAEEGAKVVLVERVEQEAKAGREAKAGQGAGAGLAVGVGAGAGARRRVVLGARAGPGGPSQEAAVVKGAMAQTNGEKGAPATTAAVLAVVITSWGIVC